MKIITWNCNGALRKKFEHLISINADICIIQECEDPARANNKEYSKWANNYLWIGDNKNKGIGVFANETIQLKQLDWSDTYDGHKVKHFLPCSINNNFNLLAIWTHNNKSPTFGYIGQLWKYLQINKSNLEKCLLIGDLNSNKQWDKLDRWWNHSDVVKDLKEIEIESLYHIHFKEEQGEESRPTFFLQRKLEKPYHIDYIFGSKDFTKNLEYLELGPKEKWLQISDHLPIYCKFKNV